MAYKPLEFGFVYTPTWGNYKAMYEVFGCPISQLAERIAGNQREKMPTPVECMAFFERVTSTPYTAQLLVDQIFLWGDHFTMLEKLIECVEAHKQIPGEYADLVKNDPPVGDGGSKKKT